MVPQAEVDSAAHGPTRPPVASRASTTPAAPATSAPNRPSSWALGLGLTGASAVVAGTALFVSARLGYDAARDHCSAANVCRSPYDDRERSAQSRATLSFIVGGSGLLLVGAAAVLHLQAGPDDKSRAQLNAAVVGPRDFRAAYTRAF